MINLFIPISVKRKLMAESRKRSTSMTRIVVDAVCRELGMELVPSQYVNIKKVN